MPGVGAAAAAGELFFGKKDAARGRSARRGLHGSVVGGTDTVKVMKVGRKHRAPHQRLKELREEQIGHRPQLVSGGGMTGDIYPETAQLLDQAPNFRAVRAQLFADLGTAYDDGCVFGEQANNAAQADVRRRVDAGRSVAPGVAAANCLRPGDARIMREIPANNKLSLLRSLGESNDRVSQPVLPFRGDTHDAGSRRQSQHDCRFASGVGKHGAARQGA